MAFDLDETIRQAESGVVPPSWDLMPLRSGYARTDGLKGLVAVLLFLALAGILIFGSIESFPGDPNTAFGVLIVALFSLAGAVLIMIYSVRALLQMGKTSEYFLVLTPEGFAEKLGSKSLGAAYTEIAGMNMYQRNTYKSALIIRRRSGKPIRLVPRRYGNATEVYALLLSKARAAKQPGAISGVPQENANLNIVPHVQGGH